MASISKKTWWIILASCIAVLLLTALILQLILPTSGSERFFAGEAEAYCQSLVDAGFPYDYAILLTELHLLHPSWSFTPLLVTQQEPDYTWDYVIASECEDEESNVIYASNTYKAYHHPLNTTLYDSGYYQASRDAVEYFMDPRNFLNETDIFQFYSLAGGASATAEGVNALLTGTFMENTKLENGMTYAEYFLELGQVLDINPLFLATKVRQEQGVGGTSPLISGACGTKLWEFYKNGTQENEAGNAVLAPPSGHTQEELLALNGLYNYFNVKATGTGIFTIYYNAMSYAQTGTAEMAEEWGGSGAWNTRWKSLYGGAYFLKNRYIDRYQSTIYLQKFNVDSRADGNFALQYMTSVFGAMSEARTLYQSFAALDALDNPATFLIPVYEGMPSRACADPANGSCTLTAQATEKFDYSFTMETPMKQAAENSAIYSTWQSYPNAMIQLTGSVSHTYQLEKLEYAWDGGPWQTASDEKKLQLSVLCNFSENTSHILTVRGKATYQTKGDQPQTIYTYVLCAVIYVDVITPPNVTLTYEVGNTKTSHTEKAGTVIQLPSSQASDFAGWCGSDGSFLPAECQVKLESDVTYTAVFLELQALDGAALVMKNEDPSLRFSASIRKDSLDTLNSLPFEAYELCAQLLPSTGDVQNGEVSQVALGIVNGREWLRLDVETSPLDTELYKAAYSASFSVHLTYSNGTEAVISAAGQNATRSAIDVAQMALADQNCRYSQEMIDFLIAITEYS